MSNKHLTPETLNSVAAFVDGLTTLSQESGIYLWHPGDFAQLQDAEGVHLGFTLSDYDADRSAERYEAVIPE